VGRGGGDKVVDAGKGGVFAELLLRERERASERERGGGGKGGEIAREGDSKKKNIRERREER
jgi:hypothetical protein